MHKLIPFKNIDANCNVALSGDLQRKGESLIVSYEIQDTGKVLDLPKSFSLAGTEIKRVDGLWKETCFEMFLKNEGEKCYFEFNFSLEPAWNVYVFKDYRVPQPPQPSNDFFLHRMFWTGNFLEVEVSTSYAIANLNASLTAVIKEKSGAKHYMALSHIGEKPDFHLPESFILKP